MGETRTGLRSSLQVEPVGLTTKCEGQGSKDNTQGFFGLGKT